MESVGFVHGDLTYANVVVLESPLQRVQQHERKHEQERDKEEEEEEEELRHICLLGVIDFDSARILTADQLVENSTALRSQRLALDRWVGKWAKG